jgi:SAM-dependent methyltransferase
MLYINDGPVKDVLIKWLGIVRSENQSTNVGYHELEGIVQHKMSKPQFVELAKGLLARGWKVTHEPEQVDISTYDHYRTSVIGADAIAAYFNTNQLKDAIVMQKRKVEESVTLDEYGPVKFNLKTESTLESLDEKEQHFSNLPRKPKSFRFKKRMSFLHTEHPDLRIDLTIVKSGREKTTSLAHSGMMAAMPSYEIEVEVIPSASGNNSETILSEFNIALNDILTTLSGGFVPASSTIAKNIIEEYSNLIGKRQFAGPSPITLDAKSLSMLKQGYSVTDKADGERCLLYIASDGKIAFIDQKLGVRLACLEEAPNGIRHTLLDGELIKREKLIDGNKLGHLYAIFDAYIVNGKDVRSLALVNSTNSGQTRLTSAQKVCDELISIKKCNVRFQVKKFVAQDGDELSKGCSTILSGARAGNLPYKIDGLIFTPREYAVGADGKDKPPKWGDYRWMYVFKWKPPEDNTIDFCVKFQMDGHPPKEQVVIRQPDGIVCKVVHLEVGFNPVTDKQLGVVDYLTPGSQVITKNTRDEYGHRPFSPVQDSIQEIHVCYLPTREGGTARCASGEEIVDGAIVEFGYAVDPRTTEFSPYHWRPLRLRADKTVANNFKTANNVWHSIVHPITEDMICGREAASLSSSSDVYYGEAGSRKDSPTYSMRIFHNFIKDKIVLQKFVYGKRSMLDLGCGRGNDIRKWVRVGLTDVVGLDLHETSIVDPENGAYARLKEIKIPPGARYVFLPYDVSQPLDAMHFNKIPDAGQRMVFQTLWGIVPRQMVKPKDLVRYHAMARDGFQAISCQFAIHYFFKDATTLKTFTENVSRSLKPGGKFIGTCMDGGRVRKLLAKVKKDQSVTKVLPDGRMLWQITKKYVDDEPPSIGQSIDVYLESINNTVTEYIMDMDVLQTAFEAVGMVLEKTGFFEDAYLDAQSSGELPEAAKNMGEGEREFSFLNRWFAFVKKN